MNTLMMTIVDVNCRIKKEAQRKLIAIIIMITLTRLKGRARLFLLTSTSFSRRSSSTRAKESTFQYLQSKDDKTSPTCEIFLNVDSLEPSEALHCSPFLNREQVVVFGF